MPRNIVTELKRISVDGPWELWRFTVEFRSRRYCWLKNGQFPCHLFNADAILYALDETEECADEDMRNLKASGNY